MTQASDFKFIGRLCLDFAQTGDMGWGARYERLTKPAALQRWLALSSLQVAGFRITTEDLAQAKKIRGAIWSVAVAILASKAPAAADLRLINQFACQPNLVKKLDPGARSASWHHPNFAAALATIAADAVALFGDPVQRARLRHCEHSPCRVIFYDDSRPGLRRWCAPNRCGDRVRARAYRQRKRP